MLRKGDIVKVIAYDHNLGDINGINRLSGEVVCIYNNAIIELKFEGHSNYYYHMGDLELITPYRNIIQLLRLRIGI